MPKLNRILVLAPILMLLNTQAYATDKLTFVCHTNPLQVSIYENSESNYFATLNIAGFVNPDDQVPVTSGSEGSNYCFVPMYYFNYGNLRFAVQEGIGCTPAEFKIPKSATGILYVSTQENLDRGFNLQFFCRDEHDDDFLE